ncbi:MAG TPA: glycosyl hydrolase [Nocardioides sp.]|nr:glycosyl hydrolase [Nocardioides sp.]
MAKLPELSLAPLPVMRMADGLTPPTNRWFSGLVFGAEPQPVFPLPLAFSIDDTSFGAGLPQIVTSAANIVGSHQQDVNLAVTQASSSVVSAYDVASVTVEARDSDGQPLGRTTVAQGSPFISHVAVHDETLTTSVPFTGSGDVVVADTATGPWAIRLDGAALDGDTLTLGKGDSFVLFPVPADGRLEDVAAAAVPISGTTASFSVGSEEVITRLTYETDGEVPGYGVLAHQASALGADCRLGSYPTVYGRLTLCSGSTLTWSAPRQHAVAALDLSALSGDERNELAVQVEADVAALPEPPADTYFGAKWAYRTAQLMEIAGQVGATEAEAVARSSLTEVLQQWTQVDGCLDRDLYCFGYDTDWKGVVGQAPAFGSEMFNDHHFHYGYFLYAAGVLAADRPSMVEELAPVMTLLAADVAGGADTGITPQFRPFDVYASHSWAAGTGDFADGNNQESSSEAVTAWAGLELWARAASDQDLERQAAWMLALEADAARTYWTDFDMRDPVYDGFDHGVMGINWGGKRDYATWFSPEPSAILGIQVIPMSPSSDYLAGDAQRIRANTADVDSGPLADYALMYSGLAGRADAQAALETARTLPDEAIDQGNSRSYLLAYLMRLSTGT